MVGALFDPNILMDYLAKVPQARDELERYETETRRFLLDFSLIDMNAEIAERAILLRRTHRMKLPDAMIWASAQVDSLLLVTRNTKDFPKDDPGVRAPYVLQ